jgi:hypothetical protein
LKIFRISYLTVNARHLILAEERKEGVNDDRIPPGGLRVKVVPGEDLILEGDDAAEFRRQLDEAFPRRVRVAAEKRGTIMGTAYDPETGKPLAPPGESVREG